MSSSSPQVKALFRNSTNTTKSSDEHYEAYLTVTLLLSYVTIVPLVLFIMELKRNKESDPDLPGISGEAILPGKSGCPVYRGRAYLTHKSYFCPKFYTKTPLRPQK
eukprot:sb/3477873/